MKDKAVNGNFHNTENEISLLRPPKDNKESQIGCESDEDPDIVNGGSRGSKLSGYCTRYRISRTLGVYLSAITTGIGQALIGTILLELQIQTQARFDLLTLLVTYVYVGKVLSAITVTFVFDRLHPELQLGMCLCLSSAVSAAIPLFSQYAMVSVLVCVQGFCLGYIVTGGQVRCFELWDSHVGPFIQGIHFMFSVGGAVTPPIAKPFITPQYNLTNETLQLALNKVSNGEEAISPVEKLEYSNENGEDFMNESQVMRNISEDKTHITLELHPGTFYPYIILTVLQAFSAALVLVLFFTDNCKLLRHKTQVDGKPSHSGQKLNIKMLILFGFLIFGTIALETTFHSMLYAYAVKHLGWDVETANTLLMSFWLGFASSRALGMIHAHYIHPQTILTVFLSLMMVALVFIASMNHISPYVMWVCVPCVGIALSIQVASILQYAGKHFSISGITSGVIMVFNYSSGMTIPALTGYLFNNVDMNWFIYVQVIIMAMMLVLFIGIRICSARILDKQTKMHNDLYLKTGNGSKKPVQTDTTL